MSGAQFTSVVSLAQLEPTQPFVFNHNGRSILVIKTDDGIFAVENRCTHADADLADGWVRNGWIACPAHGARFDLVSGEALNPPACKAIATFAVRVTDDRVEVAL